MLSSRAMSPVGTLLRGAARVGASILGAVCYANALEWVAHRYLLHGLGKSKTSPFAYHWHYHHRESRTHGYYDRGYERSLYDPAAHRPEALGMVGLAVLHLPLLPVAPLAYTVLATHAALYVAVHKRSHLDPVWARRWLPWHYDHHMAPDQDANWCVTFPLFDHILGTRVPFVDTLEELATRDARDAVAAETSRPEAVAERKRTYPSFTALLRQDLARVFGRTAAS